MKKKALIALLSVVILSMAAPSMAHRYQRNTGDNPFRLVGYVLHPVGIALEYAIMRPIHWAVSQPDTDIIFGHEPEASERGKYWEWTHGNFAPSIAEEVKTEGAVDTEAARLENKDASDEAAAALRESTEAATEKDLRERQRAEARARREAERETRKAEKAAREAAEEAAEAAEKTAKEATEPAAPEAPAEPPAAPEAPVTTQ